MGPTNEHLYTNERYEMRRSVSEKNGGWARREGWSSAISNRRAEHSVKRIKARSVSGEVVSMTLAGSLGSACKKVMDNHRHLNLPYTNLQEDLRSSERDRCRKNAMGVRETSGIQVGCGQTREGAPKNLQAFCTTQNI